MSAAYIYKAALYCPACADLIKRGHSNALVWPRTMKEDSEYWPQGPYPNGGGEADCPQHCDHCGEFLDNPLTPDGVAYVLEAIKAFDMEGRGNPETIAQWRDAYAGVLWSEATGWNDAEQSAKP